MAALEMQAAQPRPAERPEPTLVHRSEQKTAAWQSHDDAAHTGPVRLVDELEQQRGVNGRLVASEGDSKEAPRRVPLAVHRWHFGDAHLLPCDREGRLKHLLKVGAKRRRFRPAWRQLRTHARGLVWNT